MCAFRRATATTAAERIGVVGYVRNMPDGSVELLAQGSRKQIDEMKAWCHVGPPMAVVTAVEETSPLASIDTLDFKRFQMMRYGESERHGTYSSQL